MKIKGGKLKFLAIIVFTFVVLLLIILGVWEGYLLDYNEIEEILNS
jgi:hypothetical protein